MRASFLGCPIDILSMAETVEVACAAMRTRQRVQHVALNVAKFVNMRFDSVLAADVASSDIVGVDGMGIVWAARALGLPVNARVTGVDLLNELLVACESEGFRPYFLGATPAVLQRAVAMRSRKVPVACLRRPPGWLFQQGAGSRYRPRNPLKWCRLPLHRDADASEGALPRRPS